MKVAIVANTKKVKPKQVQALQRALRDAGVTSIERREISKGSAATKEAKKALKHGADVVVACGGDGTVRAAAQALVGSDAALAVLPAGTANLFASALSIGDDPSDLAGLIAGDVRRVLDTGRCNDLTFNVMAGAGFDAAMIDDADEHKERLGMLSYIRASAKAAPERKPFDMSVRIDGDTGFEGAASCILVGNIGTLKGGLEAFPDSSPTDGLLDVAVLSASGLRDWANLMFSAVRHRQQLNGHAQLWTGKEVTVKTGAKHRFELDGGVKGTADRLDFEIVPASLRVCAPAAD
ncbi:MAG: YegS/Rv2252/BmrU family lipid kinase [Actinobacteria bacterium]|nr:YegS/Rv2252/BmrU family lipid kinase [Actinomycetota bacterium]